LPAQSTGLFDFGGEALDPRHYPPLLFDRRKGNFVGQHIRRTDRSIVRGSLRLYLPAERCGADKIVEKFAIHILLDNIEQKVVTADDCAFQPIGDNAEAANFCVDFGNHKISGTACLLLLGLYDRTKNLVA
jgi:hypothetical protein